MIEQTLRRFSSGPYRLGVIGDPVAHSLSPALHQPALDQLGIPAVYERWQTPAAAIASRIEGLRRPEILGANVTVPHKRIVMELVDDVSPAARRAGAVNTICNRAGKLHGDNTDIYGFRTTIGDAFPDTPPAIALILGAGGAARAVVLALEALGVAEIIIANRNVGRAAELVADLAPAPVRAEPLEDRLLAGELPRVELLVNATSLGWHSGESPLAIAHLDRLPGNAIVADLTYRDTDLLMAAKARSLRTIDGLPMLVYQGARAFKLFTGYDPPIDTMLEAARQARSAN